MVIVMKSKIISSSPDVMGGTPVFAGTRVPVQTLLDYIEGGESIDSFLDGFPTVTKEQILAFLREVKTLIRELVEESETAARYCTR
ncbi:MAG: hypothetical protein ALAOOOJD_01499 [bacterium]|nr:hypothetical protein [bacterium]